MLGCKVPTKTYLFHHALLLVVHEFSKFLDVTVHLAVRFL